MTAGEIARPQNGRSIAQLAAKSAYALVLALLAYQAVHFYLRDPLHYIVDYSATSFG